MLKKFRMRCQSVVRCCRCALQPGGAEGLGQPKGWGMPRRSSSMSIISLIVCRSSSRSSTKRMLRSCRSEGFMSLIFPISFGCIFFICKVTDEMYKVTLQNLPKFLQNLPFFNLCVLQNRTFHFRKLLIYSSLLVAYLPILTFLLLLAFSFVSYTFFSSAEGYLTLLRFSFYDNWNNRNNGLIVNSMLSVDNNKNNFYQPKGWLPLEIFWRVFCLRVLEDNRDVITTITTETTFLLQK